MLFFVLIGSSVLISVIFCQMERPPLYTSGIVEETDLQRFKKEKKEWDFV